MIIQAVDGVPVRLREPHDLSFLQRWGRVFCTFDAQDSGNLCFGVISSAGAVFVKYAGAATLHYSGRIADAVARLRRAAPVYRALAHPSLIRLRDANGFALGALAHTMLGDDATRRREAWRGTESQYLIAAKAMQPLREKRWPSIASMAEAWRSTLP